MSVRLSVRPSTCNNSTPTVRFFTKFDIWMFFRNLSINCNFHYNLTTITGTVHADRYCTCRPVLYLQTGTVHADRYCTCRPVLYLQTGTVLADRYCACTVISRSFLLRMRNVSNETVEKTKTHILFSENRAICGTVW
jgi:hypothetical protein